MNKMNNKLNSRHCYFHLTKSNTSKIRMKEKVVLHKYACFKEKQREISLVDLFGR